MSFQLTSSAKNTQLLGNVLSLYMSNDNLIHKNLSFVIDIIVNHRLFNETREPSEELASVYRKWTVRLNSLLQSKNVAVRWCGITLVRVTCENSHTLLIANAKTWSAQLLGFVGVKYFKYLFIGMCHLCFLYRKPNLSLFTKRLSRPFHSYSHTLSINLNYKEKLQHPTFNVITNFYFNWDVSRIYYPLFSLH